jgi:hypothetical protein
MDKHNQKYNFYQVILGKGEYYGHWWNFKAYDFMEDQKQIQEIILISSDDKIEYFLRMKWKENVCEYFYRDKKTGKEKYLGHEHDINYAMGKLLSKYDTGVK